MSLVMSVSDKVVVVNFGRKIADGRPDEVRKNLEAVRAAIKKAAPKAEEIAAIKAPVLGLYGGNDARITGAVPATDSTMKKLGKSYEYHVFEGAGHGFLKQQDANPANLKAAQEAWPKTIAFFRAKLGK